VVLVVVELTHSRAVAVVRVRLSDLPQRQLSILPLELMLLMLAQAVQAWLIVRQQSRRLHTLGVLFLRVAVAQAVVKTVFKANLVVLVVEVKPLQRVEALMRLLGMTVVRTLEAIPTQVAAAATVRQVAQAQEQQVAQAETVWTSHRGQAQVAQTMLRLVVAVAHQAQAVPQARVV
jgi:hypothetical protein